MIAGLKVLGVIAARGGSKAVPGKNVRPVGGKPLIAWSIEAATDSDLLDRVVVSTDDEGIAGVARRLGCEVPFQRPPQLATDESGSVDVVLHALEQLPGFDVVTLLQPTSPLRTAADIDGALRAMVDANAPACASVTPTDPSPYWMFRCTSDGRLRPVVAGERPARRQDLPVAYVLNGAVYAARTAWLSQSRTFVTDETLAFEMPSSRSLDIDTEQDIARCEALMTAGRTTR
jgi:N-acylneuraminate cytidylyltransferase